MYKVHRKERQMSYSVFLPDDNNRVSTGLLCTFNKGDACSGKNVENIQVCNLVTGSFLKIHSLAITTIKSGEYFRREEKDFIKRTHY